MRIPFDIKFRPQIESGEYKVETHSGYPVTIYRWDFNDGGQTPIMGSYVFEDGKEYVGAWNEEGHFDLMSPNDLDLFLITPDEKLMPSEDLEKAAFNNGRYATLADAWEKGLQCRVIKDVIGQKVIQLFGMNSSAEIEKILSKIDAGERIRLVFMKEERIINE